GSTGGRTRNRSCCRGAIGGNDDQVARTGRVNSTLDGARRGDAGRRFAADGGGHGVDRLFAVGCRDDQFPALRGLARNWASVLLLLLEGAVRHAVWNSDCDGGVAPTGNVRTHPADGHSPRRSAKAIVAGGCSLF